MGYFLSDDSLIAVLLTQFSRLTRDGVDVGLQSLGISLSTPLARLLYILAVGFFLAIVEWSIRCGILLKIRVMFMMEK